MSKFQLYPKGVTSVFESTWNSKKKVVVHQGGTSSGKTYGLMQVAFAKAIAEPRSRILIVGQDVPNLKSGAWSDLENIVQENPHLEQYIRKINNSDKVYYFWNGSRIDFKAFESGQDAKSGKRDYAFFNEANGINYEIFFEISMRTYKQVWIDFNPNAEFWAHTEVIYPQMLDENGDPMVDEMGRAVRKKDPDVDFFITNWRDNPFLGQDTIKKIEKIKHTDPELYKIYGLGEIGKIEGLVFKNVEVIDQWPDEIINNPLRYRYAQGLDFGFSDDPCAGIRRAVKDNCLYVDELFYRKGLRIHELATLIQNYHQVGTFWWADSARPDTILELVDRGCEVVGAKKAPGSIVAGLELMQSYDKIYVTARSVNLRHEFANYTYQKDKKDMRNKPVPVDYFNHGIDAARYAELMDKYIRAEIVFTIDPKNDEMQVDEYYY